MALPVDALRSSALANIITAVFSMLVSLILVPALIFIWGEKLLQYQEAIRLFFATYFSQLLPFWFPSKQQTVRIVVDDEEKGETEAVTSGRDGTSSLGWLSFGKWILVPRNGVIILTILGCLIIPFAVKVFQMRSYPDWTSDSPMNSESYQTIEALGNYSCPCTQRFPFLIVNLAMVSIQVRAFISKAYTCQTTFFLWPNPGDGLPGFSSLSHGRRWGPL